MDGQGSATQLRANLRWLLRLQVWVAERLKPTQWQATLWWAALVGALAAVGALGFKLVTEEVIKLIGSSAGVVESFRLLPWWGRLITPALGGLVAGALLLVGSRFLKQDASTDYMEAIVIGTGKIPTRASIARILAGVFSIGSGGSIGREGPMVQIAAVIASRLGRWQGFAPPQLRLMVACGAAGGITSAYNAPIAGAFFVAEIILGSIAMGSLGPLVAASVAASLTMRALTNVQTLYQVPTFTLHSLWEMGPYLVLGLLAGAAAPRFLDSLRAAERLFHRYRWPPWLRLALGGLIVGALAIRVPDVVGNGYSEVIDILHGRFAWEMVLLVVLCKWLATAASFGSGAPGGVFTPSLFMGASLGYLFGAAVHAVWPAGAANPEAFALVGMGAFLSAATHAPLMAVIMLFEMTLSYDIILPLLACSVLAYYVAKGLASPPMYAAAVARDKAVRLRARAGKGPLRVRQLMKTNPPVVRINTPFAEIARMFLANRVNNIYVIDPSDRFVGAISLHDIKPTLTESAIAHLVIADDVVDRGFPHLLLEHNLDEARSRFATVEAERLPVLDTEGVLKGSLAKTELLLALEERLRDLARDPHDRTMFDT